MKAGKPWAGAVKNRRKNGDYLLGAGERDARSGKTVSVTGYMSIRTKLPADQRKEAEQVYAQIRAKQCRTTAVPTASSAS